MEIRTLINENYQKLLLALNNSSCCVPSPPADGVFFPVHVYRLIDNWINDFINNIGPLISVLMPDSTLYTTEVMVNRLIALKQGINHTLITYYRGDLLRATRAFNKTLDSTFFHSMSQPDFKLPTNQEFYRARINEDRDFTRSDLFHIPFEQRYKVSTNRYSIPGLPALYLGGSAYVCWEEFNRYRFRDMCFARLLSTEELNIIRILRIADFLKELENKQITDAVHHIWQYIAIFPITLACTICVEHPNGPFKPEYIIPQLLVRYVSDKKILDGVMYPSTKVDYSAIQNVSAYNYVFPVKTINKIGYCYRLKRNFAISEPTSVELEELLFKTDQAFSGAFPDASKATVPQQLIKLKEDDFRLYEHTSFGFIEQRLKKGKVKSLL